MNEITIIGAGLTGSLLGIYLARLNYKVHLFEKRVDQRLTNISAGRSINLALSSRGIVALEEVGLKQQVLSKSIKMMGREIHPLSDENNSYYLPYGRNSNECLYAISRADLNIVLLNELEKFPHIKIDFEKELEQVDWDKNTLFFKDNSSHHFDVVIGADGYSGALSSSMNLDELRKENLEHCYLELSMPANKNKLHCIEKERLHIWPRVDFMLIALPNRGGDFTCTLFMPDQIAKKMQGDNWNKFKTFFDSNFPDAAQYMPDLKVDYINNPISPLSTLYSFPWHYQSKALLIGDAAHSIVPFYGQGMNCCFEDCRIFNSLIPQYKNDWEKLFIAFSNLRKKNTDAIAHMAIENYLEMREYTANELFNFQKIVEKELTDHFSDSYISQYHMVTFMPEIDYSYIENQAIKQKRVFQSYCTKDRFEQYQKDKFIPVSDLKNLMNDLRGDTY